MKIIFIKVMILSLICILDMKIYASEPYQKLLHKNPFLKPTSFNVDATNATNERIAVEVDELILRATLVSGDEGSIANINGEMVLVGQKINGYQLMSVDTGSAVLMNNGKEINLVVNENYNIEK